MATRLKCAFFTPVSLYIHLTVALFAFKKFLSFWIYQSPTSAVLLIGSSLQFLYCASWKSELHSTVAGCHFYSFLRWSSQWQCSQGGVFMIIKSWSLPLKKNWQFAQEKILSSVTIFNLLSCWELSSLEELSGFKSSLDVEIVSLTFFLSAHLP